jgi:hypothetical protein
MDEIGQYDREHVEKHIAAVHISGNLTTNERKLMNVLLRNARDEIMDESILTHRIPVAMLLSMTGYGKGVTNNLNPLKDLIRGLVSTIIRFDTLYDREQEEAKAQKKGRAVREHWGISALLAGAEFEDGWCIYQYSEVLKKHLKKREVWSRINIGIQRQFEGAHSLALYENCARFRDANGHSTGTISIDLWRQLLGIGIDSQGNRKKSAYDEFKHFRAQVLVPAIAEVNTVSDIEIEPVWKKEGRKVTALQFIVREKRQQGIAELPRDDEAARQTDTYKQLRALNIPDVSACDWLYLDPEYAAFTARTLKVGIEAKHIRSPLLYGKSMFAKRDTDATFKAEREARAQTAQAGKVTDAEREKDARAGAKKSASADLTNAELAYLRRAFIEQNGARWIEDAQRFDGALANTAFRTFCIERAADVIAARK